jgi:hypothetical protein
MNTCYKIVGENYPFAYTFNIKNCASILPGTQFKARQPMYGGYYISGDLVPFIHFTDNAFDTMLWFSLFSLNTDQQYSHTIYEIKPLTRMTKQKCNDELGFYQCGAWIVEFGRIISKQEMFRRALAEFYQSTRIKSLYQNLPLDKIIAAFAKQQCFQFDNNATPAFLRVCVLVEKFLHLAS